MKAHTQTGGVSLSLTHTRAETMWDGPRPDPKLACCVSKTATYQPMRKKGAIILGTGGDNSNSAMGNFYEGVIATGKASNRSNAPFFGPECKLKTIDLPRQAWDTPEETLKKRCVFCRRQFGCDRRRNPEEHHCRGLQSPPPLIMSLSCLLMMVSTP